MLSSPRWWMEEPVHMIGNSLEHTNCLLPQQKHWNEPAWLWELRLWERSIPSRKPSFERLSLPSVAGDKSCSEQGVNNLNQSRVQSGFPWFKCVWYLVIRESQNFVEAVQLRSKASQCNEAWKRQLELGPFSFRKSRISQQNWTSRRFSSGLLSSGNKNSLHSSHSHKMQARQTLTSERNANTADSEVSDF